MNLTVLSLVSSSLTYSPILMVPSTLYKPSIKLMSLSAQNFFSNFIFSKSNTIKADISMSSFIHFVKTPLSFQESKLLGVSICTQDQFDKQDFSQQSTIVDCTDYPSISITNCNFKNIDITPYDKGGAIYYKGTGSLIVHGSTFDKCSAKSGAGIFAASDDANEDLGWAALFHSHYCCYSSCSASDYGSAVYASATDLQLNYSSTLNCPFSEKVEKSHGAQMDLRSNTFIASSHINSTYGKSDYCSALEYRKSQSGFFRFQNIIHHEGGYITAFSGLQTAVDISSCNIVDVTVTKPSGSVKAAVLYVIDHPVTISNFIIFNVNFNAGCLIDIESGTFRNTIKDSYVNFDYGTLNNVQIENVQVVKDSDGVTTRPIIQLNLGECVGDYEKEIPPIGEVDNGKDEEFDDEPTELILNTPVKEPEENPDKPEQPEKSEVPENPENPEHPENPENPENTEHPENPEDSSTEHKSEEIIESLEITTDPSPDENDKNQEERAPKKKKNNAGMIAGVTIACVAVAGAGVAAGVIFYLKKKSPVAGATAPNNNNEDENQP